MVTFPLISFQPRPAGVRLLVLDSPETMTYEEAAETVQMGQDVPFENEETSSDTTTSDDTAQTDLPPETAVGILLALGPALFPLPSRAAQQFRQRRPAGEATQAIPERV